MEKGYMHIYTGNGKGKTTAAFGLALRAAMSGKKVYIGQFIKGMAYEETKCSEFIPEIKIEQYGTECFIDRKPDDADKKRAKDGLELCREALSNGKYDVEVILTGRYASDKLIEMADLVSEIKEIKHYYSQGVLSRKGIDC